jgi:hypothetical protein
MSCVYAYATSSWIPSCPDDQKERGRPVPTLTSPRMTRTICSAALGPGSDELNVAHFEFCLADLPTF